MQPKVSSFADISLWWWYKKSFIWAVKRNRPGYRRLYLGNGA